MTEPTSVPTGAIAVIGMACRYPRANTPDEFWRNIVGKVECIRFFSEAELRQAGVSAQELARPNYVRAAGVLEDVAGFDAALFGISGREAQVMDPQHRVFMECCWAALEDAAIDPSRTDARIGVFAGCNMSGYALQQLDALASNNSTHYLEALVGNDKDYLTTRVSYRLNLRGPSVAVGTACSTSLSAVAIACQNLSAFTCDVVLAGGVCISGSALRGYQYGDGSDALSTDGHCRAFDAAASGTAPSQGAGVVVLKRLEDALADADAIYAVIRGYALANDGRDKVGYWAPSVAGHTETVAEALDFAQIDARDIGYVEAHGTGTPMGDPIEIAALTSAFRAYTPETGYCAIGSVKTNIGHTSQAAGVAGLIKAALAVHHGQLPPSLNFERPNPKLQLEASPFYVNTETRPWQAPRRAGVSSLGLGGTNVHVVLEQAPAVIARAGSERDRPALLPLSANSETALNEAAERLLSHLDARPELALSAVASSLQRGRRQLPVRGYVVARSSSHAREQLRGRNEKRWARRLPARPAEVVFVFPGAADVDLAALQRLSQQFPVVAEVLAEGIQHARALGIDLSSLSNAGAVVHDSIHLGDLPCALAVLLLTEVALARLLLHCAVQPVAVIGHSSGEYAAACISGVLSLADALRLQVGRARLLVSLPKGGAKLSVNLSAAELVQRLGREVAISAENADDVTLISGDADQLTEWSKRLSSESVVCQPSSVLGAAHSRGVEPMLPQLRTLAQSVTYNAPTLTWISTTTGAAMPVAPVAPEHWVRHTRDAVRYADAVTAAAVNESRLFVEVGPGGHLTSLVQRIVRMRGLSNVALSSMPGPNTDAAEYLLNQAGRMWALGVPLDLITLGDSRSVVPARLPTYAFEHVPYWIESGAGTLATRSAQQASPIVGTPAGAGAPYLYRPVWVRNPLQPKAAGAVARSWVLLSDGCALCAALARHATHNQHDLLPVLCCSASPAPSAGDHALVIDPTRAEAMQKLFSLLRARYPEGVDLIRCHAGMNSAEVVELEPAAFAQGLIASGYAAPVQWVLLSANAQPVLGSERLQAAVCRMAVAVRILPRELSNVQTRWLDVDAELAPANCERMAAAIAAELAEPAGFQPIAYRHGQRWEREYRSVVDDTQASPWRDDGRYLITGGLGRMGLSLAQYLTERPCVRVALAYSRQLPPEDEWRALASADAEVGSTGQILHALLHLRARGAQLELARVDAGDERDMTALVETLERSWGGIDGVFHLAATTDETAFCLLADAGAEAPDANQGPKLRGAQILERLAERHRFQFCCLASSLSSELGRLGNYAYASANRGLDLLVHDRQQRAAHDTRWLAINFDYYRPQAAEDGRSDPREQRSGALQNLAAEGALRGRDLLQIVERALALHGEPQVLACAVPVEELVARFIATAQPRQGRAPRPDLSSCYVAASTQLQQDMLDIWQELLCVAPIGVRDNFFELGGDSLIVLRLINLYRERLGQNLEVKVLLSSPTIEELCLAIGQKQRAPDLFPLRSVAAPRHTLFCVPYAGGSALGFKPLSEQLPPDCALMVLPAPREVSDLDALLGSISVQLREWPTPFSIYGHCAGSFAAVELARRVEQLGRRPERVFAAGTLPPEAGTTLAESTQRAMTATSDADLKVFLQTIGGLPDDASEADALDAFTAMQDDGVRVSDVFEQFRQRAAQQRLQAPLVCLFGAADPLTLDWERRFQDWTNYFEHVTHHVLPDAGHYFVHTQPQEVASLLGGELWPTT